MQKPRKMEHGRFFGYASPRPSWHPGLTEQFERGLLLLLLTPHSSFFPLLVWGGFKSYFRILGCQRSKMGRSRKCCCCFLYTIGCRFNDPVGVSFPDLLLPSDTPVFQGMYTTPSFFPQKRCLAFGRADKCFLSLFSFSVYSGRLSGVSGYVHTLIASPKKSISLSAGDRTHDG